MVAKNRVAVVMVMVEKNTIKADIVAVVKNIVKVVANRVEMVVVNNRVRDTERLKKTMG